MASQTASAVVDSSAFDGTRWDGERIAALAAGVAGESDREPITVRAPAVDEPIGTIPRLGEGAVHRAVERAREAGEAWADRPVDERAAVLDSFADLVERHQGELLDLIQLETGKARRDALEEIIDPSIWANYYAESGPELLADERRQSLVPFVTTAEVVYDPVGVAGIISPWNYPLALSFIDAIPAMFAGNGVVIKPDDRTPYTALRLEELFVEAGLPPELCQIVTGDGPEVGSALMERVDHVTFTGSTETGRIVAEQAGRQLVDCSLELGGKNPMLVLADANVNEAVRGALIGAFTNAGQLCLAAERIYVEEPLYEEFLERFVEKTADLSLGASYDYGPDVGSIIDGTQLERVAGHVEDARERGATVHVGGEKRPDVGPHFYEPTVLTDVPSESLPACEETFGPVVRVEPVPSAEAGVEAANDSAYGLNGSIFTGDRERGAELAREIECGTVNVNDAYATAYSAPGAPMGGMKDSGIGHRQGPEGLKRYVEAKTIATSRIGPVGAPPFVPDRVYAWSLLSMTRTYRRLRKKLR
jgi:succinate-semialdehyde dehydrogenase/glutarate-semialdehyde dehydrogenase